MESEKKSSQSKYWTLGIILLLTILLTLYFVLRITPPETNIDRLIRQMDEAWEGSKISDKQYSRIEDEKDAESISEALDNPEFKPRTYAEEQYVNGKIADKIELIHEARREKDAARARYKLDKYNQEYEERHAKEADATAAPPSVQTDPSVQIDLPEIAAVEDEVALPPLTEESVNK